MSYGDEVRKLGVEDLAYEDYISPGGVSVSGIQPVDVRAYGATSDATTSAGTDSSAGFQAAINDATSGSVVLAAGNYRINSAVNLKANITYDFRGATFYGGTLTNTWLFRGNATDNITVIGGRYMSSASYSSTTTIPTGTYTDFVAFQFDNCSNVKVYGGEYYGMWGVLNFYDTILSSVVGTYSLNGNASVAAVAISRNVYGIKILNNTFVGNGDDGVAVGQTAASGAYNFTDSIISGNYIDKTRLDDSVGAAVGIRAGRYGGTGILKGITISNNILKDMVEHGIYIHDISDSLVYGNTINGYAKRASSAISVGTVASGREGQRVTIYGNLVINPLSTSAYAMYVSYTDNSTILNNTLIGNFSSVGALLMQNSNNNKITENRIENALGPAFQETDASNHNKFTNNDVWLNGSGGSHDGGWKSIVGSTTEMSGNRVSSTGKTKGWASLVAGTVTVSTTEIESNEYPIILTKNQAQGYSGGTLSVGTITPGVSFVINSYHDNGALATSDTSPIYWEIRH